MFERAAGRGACDCGTDIVAGRVLMNVHHVVALLVEWRETGSDRPSPQFSTRAGLISHVTHVQK
jgi:hypothetical protein